MSITRIVTSTNLQKDPNVVTAVTALDVQNTILMDGFIAAPPPGYQVGTIRTLGPMGMVFDGTNYNVWQSFQFETVI